MYFLKLTLSILFLFPFSTTVIAQTDSSNKSISRAEFTRVMKKNTEYCRTEAGVLDTKHVTIAADCRRYCESFGIVQTSKVPGNLPSGKAGQPLREAMENCITSYNEAKRLVDAFELAHPSISKVLGLKNTDAKSEVDSGYNQCLKNSIRTPKHYSPEKCLCTATVVVNTINERGSYTRIYAAFSRLVAGCRGE